jgi:hypothetical protein
VQLGNLRSASVPFILASPSPSTDAPAPAAPPAAPPPAPPAAPAQ